MFVKEITFMSFENYFPLWNDLNTAQKKLISDNLITQDVKKGTIMYNGNLDCTDYYWLNPDSFELTYFQMKDGRLHFTVCSIWICVFYPPHVSCGLFNLK